MCLEGTSPTVFGELKFLASKVKLNQMSDCHIKVKDRCLWLQAVTATQDSAIINVLKPSEVLIPPLNTAGDIWLDNLIYILYGCVLTSLVFNHGYYVFIYFAAVVHRMTFGDLNILVYSCLNFI